MIVLAVTLLVGSVAAFTYTQKLKLERSPVSTARFERWLSPECGCPGRTARLSFLLRERERIDATIVDGDGSFVKTLLARSEQGPGRVRTEWDGRDEAGTEPRAIQKASRACTWPSARCRAAPIVLKMAPCRMSVPTARTTLKSKTSTRMGVISDPPPIPVRPTRIPIRSPVSVNCQVTTL